MALNVKACRLSFGKFCRARLTGDLSDAWPRWALSLCWQRRILQGGVLGSSGDKVVKIDFDCGSFVVIDLRYLNVDRCHPNKIVLQIDQIDPCLPERQRWGDCQFDFGPWRVFNATCWQAIGGAYDNLLLVLVVVGFRPGHFAAQFWLCLATRRMFSINKVEGDLFIFWKEWHHRTVSCLCHPFSECAKVSFLSQLIWSTQNSVQADECNKYVGLASGTRSQEILSKGRQLPPPATLLWPYPKTIIYFKNALQPSFTSCCPIPPQAPLTRMLFNVMDCGSASLEHSRPPLVHRATAEVIGFFYPLWVCQCCWNPPIHRWENFWSTKNRDFGEAQLPDVNPTLYARPLWPFISDGHPEAFRCCCLASQPSHLCICKQWEKWQNGRRTFFKSVAWFVEVTRQYMSPWFQAALPRRLHIVAYSNSNILKAQRFVE